MTCTDGTTSSLFDLAELRERAALIASPMARLLPGEKVVDLFCGAGGWTASPLLRAAGIRVDYAVNHSAVAIEWHRANNPGCVHVQGDAWKARPLDVMGDEELGLLLASAACTSHSNARGAAPISPRVHMLGWCIARWIKEKRPRLVEVENVAEWQKWGPLIPKRDAAGRILRDPETGKVLRVPDKAREGSHFRRWVRYCRGQGYKVEFRVIDAADHGNASRRKRLFVRMRRDGLPIVWPEKTHGSVSGGRDYTVGASVRRLVLRQHRRGYQVLEQSGQASALGSPAESENGSWRGVLDGSQISSARAGEGPSGFEDGRAPRGPHPYRCAADIIDWSDLGRSIFEGPRNKKSYGGTRLAKKTLGRACEGIWRFVLEDAKPFTLRVTHADGKGWKVSAIDAALPTQTGRQDQAVCTPVVQAFRGNAAPRSPEDPLPTITAGNGPGRGAAAGHALGLITPIIAKTCMHGSNGSCCSRIDETAPTQTTCQDAAMLGVVIAPQNGGVCGQRPDAPGPAITTKGHQSLVAPVMIAQRNNAVGSSPLDPAPGICASSQHNCVGTPVMLTVGWGERAGQAPRCNSVREPGLTVPAEGVKQGVGVPVMTTFYGTGTNAGDMRDPLRTATTKDRHGFATPVGEIAGAMGDSWGRGMRARAVKVGRLLKKFLGDRVRLNAEGMALAVVPAETGELIEYVIVDILFRMLRPHELAAAMGFPEGYLFPKVQRDAVRLIGNAVAVPMAEALIFASLPGMRPPKREMVAA